MSLMYNTSFMTSNQAIRFIEGPLGSKASLVEQSLQKFLGAGLYEKIMRYIWRGCPIQVSMNCLLIYVKFKIYCIFRLVENCRTWTGSLCMNVAESVLTVEMRSV